MLNDRLVQLRKKVNLTQVDLAKKIGITRSALSQYELGSRQPDYDTLQKLAEYFEVSIDYLLTGKEHNSYIEVAGKEITLSPEELKVFEEIKKYPALWHDLSSNPEKKVKQLIKMWKFIKKDLNEDDEKSGDIIED